MHAGLCITQCDIRDAGNGLGRIDGMVMLEDAAVAMRCVFAQAHVRSQVEFREQLPKLLDSLNDWPMCIVCRGSSFVLSSVSKCVSGRSGPKQVKWSAKPWDSSTAHQIG